MEGVHDGEGGGCVFKNNHSLPHHHPTCLYEIITGFRDLSPKLLHIFEHHVTVAIKGLDAGQKLFVVPAIDQNLVTSWKKNTRARNAVGQT